MRMTAHRPLLIVALAILLLAFGSLFSAQARPITRPQATELAASIPTVESDHPYENNTDKFWTIPNTGGENAARLHFSRIELEEGVDQIFIYDANDTLIQEISTSAPDGMWSDPVPGASIKVALKSDGSGRFWGFAIDQLEPVNYPTIHYSPHPYPNNAKLERTFVNDAANPAGTRVRFDRIDLEDGVDYIVIYDLDNTPYQWITGSHPTGLTSKAVPGAGIKVQLISDGSVRHWGYNLVAVESGTPTAPEDPPQRVTLAESDHPYTGEAEQTWTITNPNVNATSSKVHFSRIELFRATLQVLDANDTVIQTFGWDTNKQDVWSDYVPGRVVKLKLLYHCCDAWWGFRADSIVDSIPNPGLAQSDHPYTSEADQSWTITNPNVNATSSKVHFSRIELFRATLQVLDANDTVIQTFGWDTNKQDVWSDYVPGRVVKLKLLYHCCDAWWGFRADSIVDSIPNPGLAQSDHPYTSEADQSWTITNPNVNATSSKVHFSRIELFRATLQVLDANDTVIQTFGWDTNKQDVWSDYVPGRVVKLKLLYHCCDAWWGFRVDAIEPSSADPVPPAGINGVYVQINAPGDVYLNGKKIFRVTAAGEYRIPLAAAAGVAIRDAALAAVAPGLYSIRIEHATSEQTIEVRVEATGGIEIVYLPMVRR
ncbi:hypothetical protein EYB53_023715 [Candidatus Chloroploca sp. M-50]|uniref:CUB domain-containing protein n=1 Tax=Candidatus Chloroploca mongolica TaxID=2528176 RepID=A0ABS4DH51_9CHLR|nr:hypothetical protein [Candidatus Chloroploca mongolica]MBP1468743.1 hypothetical protein [Candidatus Chloroploca mongolica]